MWEDHMRSLLNTEGGRGNSTWRKELTDPSLLQNSTARMPQCCAQCCGAILCLGPSLSHIQAFSSPGIRLQESSKVSNKMSMIYEECLDQYRAGRPCPDTPDSVLQQFDMSSKVCIVTGASRGIGAAVADALGEAGADVVMVSTSSTAEIREKAISLSEQHKRSIVHYACDVCKATEVEGLVNHVREQFGKVDVFVANAGVCNPGSMLEQTLEEYHDQFAVNVHGVFYCARYAGLCFRSQGFGNFIITSSVSGRVVTVPIDHTVYNVTKAAVTHMGRSLAREWRDFARVNVVSPGWINTEMSTCQGSINEARRMAVLGRLGTILLAPLTAKLVYQTDKKR